MKKKIRFPLKLADGTQARTLDELREHFDLESVLGYYKNGKLLTWLENRYLEGEAEAVRSLDESASDFQRRLCEVFQVEYTGNDADMEAVQLRQERLAKLRTITDEQEFIDHIDQIAFDQENLADLLDEDETRIYLCGAKFTVPASRKGITYVGIENPKVHISGKVPETAEELGITFVNIACDNLPQTAVSKDTCAKAAEKPARLSDSDYFGMLADAFLELNSAAKIAAQDKTAIRVPAKTRDGSIWTVATSDNNGWIMQCAQHPEVKIRINVVDLRVWTRYATGAPELNLWREMRGATPEAAKKQLPPVTNGMAALLAAVRK